jgi:hypothetical protein
MNDTTTAAMWRHMLKHGGRWTAAELMPVSQRTRDNTDNLLASMVRAGLVVGHRSGERKNGRAYGVLAGCKVPRGITVEEVLTLTAATDAQ